MQLVRYLTNNFELWQKFEKGTKMAPKVKSQGQVSPKSNYQQMFLYHITPISDMVSSFSVIA